MGGIVVGDVVISRYRSDCSRGAIMVILRESNVGYKEI